jgi:hypothetical protein
MLRPFYAFLLALCALGLLLAGPALAQDDDDFEDDEVLDDDDDDDDPGIDDEQTYKTYKADLRGESPAEEIDAWYRYLDAYPNSLYRLEIERRMEALEEAAFEELLQERAETDDDARVDARRQEMAVAEPAMIGMNPNTRRRFEFNLLWGYNDYINYELGLEWALARKFSVFGGITHQGRGFGGALQVGAKYALVKDVRTGIVLSGAFSIRAGYSALDRLSFILEPYIGFAWLASDKFQLQTSLAFDIRVDRINTWLLWDIMAVINPTDAFGIYIESKQKHSLYFPEDLGTQYLAFFQAGIGAKIRPTPLIEITIGANVPYFYRMWKDYEYFGIHADMTFYFANMPKK